MFPCVCKQTFHITLVCITQKVNVIIRNLRHIIFIRRQRYLLDFQICISVLLMLWCNPRDTQVKLNVHKTFRRRPVPLLNVLCYVQFMSCVQGEAQRNIKASVEIATHANFLKCVFKFFPSAVSKKTQKSKVNVQ